MPINIKDRLIELLKERKIKHHLIDQPNNNSVPWIIQYKRDNGDGLGVWHYIVPTSLICEQDWMLDEPSGLKEWLIELDELFIFKFGMTHDDFDDYNWKDEYDSEVEPQDAFEEWDIHTESGTRSPH